MIDTISETRPKESGGGGGAVGFTSAASPNIGFPLFALSPECGRDSAGVSFSHHFHEHFIRFHRFEGYFCTFFAKKDRF